MKKTLLYFSLFVLSTFISSAQSIKEARKLTDNEQYEESSAMYEKLIGGSPAEANLYYFLVTIFCQATMLILLKLFLK